MSRRVGLVTDASFYAGPDIARLLAAREHDLVLCDPSPELVQELEALGARVEAVEGARDISKPESSARLVDAAVARAKVDLRAKPGPIARPVVCPAAGYVIAPVVESDPDAEWRGYARGINSVLDALGPAPAGDDSAGGAAGLPGGTEAGP